MYFFSSAHLCDTSPKYAHLTFFTSEPRTRDVIDAWKKYMGYVVEGLVELLSKFQINWSITTARFMALQTLSAHT